MRDPKLFDQSHRFRFPLGEGVICRVDFARFETVGEGEWVVPERELDKPAARSIRRRAQSLAAWTLLRDELARRLMVDPQELRFIHTAEGKPLLESPHGKTHFNLSHSEDHVMAAFSSIGPIGADVAEPRRCPSSVIDRFPTSERRVLSQLEGSERVRTFTRLWAVKEACMKCRGRGSISSVEAGLGTSGRWGGVHWHRVEPTPGVVAAVAVGVG